MGWKAVLAILSFRESGLFESLAHKRLGMETAL
jgi:hypothetical protein